MSHMQVPEANDKIAIAALLNIQDQSEKLVEIMSHGSHPTAEQAITLGVIIFKTKSLVNSIERLIV